MNRDLETPLEDLFKEAPELAAGTELLERIDTSISRLQRRRKFSWFGAEAAILVVAWLLSEPLTTLIGQFMPWMMTALIDTGDGATGQLLAPINSVAGVLALCALVGGVIYRRFLRR